MDATRREALLGALGIAASSEIAQALQHAHQSARTGGATFQTLSPDQAQEIEALACCILPSGDGPGAREAGVIYFIDRALTTFDAGRKDAYLSGMAEAQRTRAEMFPESSSISGLSEGHQIELLRAIETTPFFELLRTHTVTGFLGNPDYGGNRDAVGWTYIGFEDRMAFEPPFGFYDANPGKGAE